MIQVGECIGSNTISSETSAKTKKFVIIVIRLFSSSGNWSRTNIKKAIQIVSE